MTGADLFLLVALSAGLAGLLGLLGGLLVERLNRPPPPPPPAQGSPEAQLAEAEAARDAAIREMEETRTRFSRALAERQAELDATMEGLGQVRREAAELRARLEARDRG